MKMNKKEIRKNGGIIKRDGTIEFGPEITTIGSGKGISIFGKRVYQYEDDVVHEYGDIIVVGDQKFELENGQIVEYHDGDVIDGRDLIFFPEEIRK